MNAWLTPDIEQLSGSLDTRFISVPGSLWYLVSGALILLADERNWEMSGTATPDEMAGFFADVLDEFWTEEIAILIN